GVVVTLTGTTAAGAPVNRTATTAADGSYSFADLPAGTYTLSETQPAGLYDGPDAAGNSGGQPGNDVVSAVVLAPGTDGTGYLFGEFPPADPFGFGYRDLNGNGVRDAGEPGVAGVAVTIAGTAFAGTPQARPLTGADLPGGSLTVLTDLAGRWEFAP